jgi:filamentous hemagglutinin family protein
VNQQSQNLALNWLGFSISPTQTVQFVQPSATAIALNRVIGTDASQIYGHLVANGQVFLINPNGVLFAPGAQVDVGSLVASSLNISNADFLAGNYKFQTGSASAASVINQGSITAAAGGSVALLGGQVSNQGTITAQLGTVALAAGSAMTLDFRGNKLMSVQVDRSAVGALAENRQLIQADGGTVIMTAAARDALLSTVVNNTGVIEARTLQDQDGVIKLLGAPEGGTVNVGGTLDASAPGGGNGGSIETSGAHVEIADSAHITTTAANGKTGTWLVDPTDFTIAPTGGDITGATLSGELASTSVTLASSSGSVSGNGDIFVNDAVSWSASTTLTLTAARNIQINGTITASGNTAGLALNYGSGGNYYVNTGGKVTLSGTNPSFSVNSQAYTVINSLGVQGDATSTTLQGILNNLSGFYVLGTDIDASATSGWNSGAGFAPLGSSSAPFTGVFDGLNHTITALTINRPSHPFVGLFSDNSGTIRNIGLSGGSVAGSVDVGALVGYNTGGTIYNSYATANVSSTSSQAGGLVGETDGGSISNSYASGNVSGTNYVGGLVGYMPIGGAISASYASGNVTAAGFDDGGLVGYMSTNSVSYPSITNSYATGTVAGTASVGGLVGALVNGSITNSYSAGAVTGTVSSGGLVGASASGTTIANSFWNVTTSGLSTSSGGTGMTTAQMQALADFTSATASNGNVNPNWDFTSVWRIYDGYTAPLLKALLTPLTVTADNFSATYNGTSSSATLENPVYSVAGADTSGHLQGLTTPYANDRNVGTYSPVLWSDQQGYDITVKNSALTITPATLTITAASNTKTYDGTVTATALPTVSGLQAGDSITGLTEAYADKNAGTGKTLSVTGYSVSDSNGGNNYTSALSPTPAGRSTRRP